MGHAQHDSAEYVPREMLKYWRARDPLERYEKFLTENKLWDEPAKAALNARVERELAEDLAFAESSPFPPLELAEQGVYCEGCHKIEAQWQRPKEELLPPKSSVRAAWVVKDFGGVLAGSAGAAGSGPARGGDAPGNGTAGTGRTKPSRKAKPTRASQSPKRR
jgi:hypothetical protein